MSTKTNKKCSVIYSGPTYPKLHGVRCVFDSPHEGVRHHVVVDEKPLWWWTEEEKKMLRKKEP